MPRSARSCPDERSPTPLRETDTMRQMTSDVSHPVDRMLELWAVPPPTETSAALAAFRSVYADPYLVNGEEVTVETIISRAQLLHTALAGLRHEVVDRIDTGNRTVLVMMQTARHVGVLPTPIGSLQPTGLFVERRLIEVITTDADRMLQAWVTGDDMGRLRQLNAVRLVQPG